MATKKADEKHKKAQKHEDHLRNDQNDIEKTECNFSKLNFRSKQEQLCKEIFMVKFYNPIFIT